MITDRDTPTVQWLDQSGNLAETVRNVFESAFIVDGPHPVTGTIRPTEDAAVILITITRFDRFIEMLIRTYDATTPTHRIPLCVMADSLPSDNVIRIIDSGADDVLFFSERPDVIRARIKAMIRTGDRIRILEGRQFETSRRLAEVSHEKNIADELVFQLEAKEEEVRRQSLEIEKLLKEIHGQLLAATDLQQNLLPKVVPDPASVRLFDRFIPAGALGGDFYDYVIHDGADFDVIIADTSGHGVSAALVSVQVRAVIRTFIQDALNAGHRPEPFEILEHINAFMLNSFGGAFFMTMFYLAYRSEPGVIIYSGAGHNPFLFLGARIGGPEQFFSQNLPLGLIADAKFTQSAIQWEPGDRVLLYTDGLVEVTGADGEVYGPDRLIRKVIDSYESHGDELLDALLNDVNAYGGMPSSYLDDVTMILMERSV